MDWFLYDMDLRHEKVKVIFMKCELQIKLMSKANQKNGENDSNK